MLAEHEGDFEIVDTTVRNKSREGAELKEQKRYWNVIFDMPLNEEAAVQESKWRRQSHFLELDGDF
jgi:hypothetical protein